MARAKLDVYDKILRRIGKQAAAEQRAGIEPREGSATWRVVEADVAMQQSRAALEAYLRPEVEAAAARQARRARPDEDEIRRALDRSIEELANASAAGAWSTLGDVLEDRYGGDAIMVAEFGDAVGVNGDILEFYRGRARLRTRPPRIPRGYEQAQRGGRVPSTEEEVGLDHVVRSAQRTLGAHRISEARLEDIARTLGYGDRNGQIYTTVSGNTYLYARRRP
jgi:hypothetical protein